MSRLKDMFEHGQIIVKLDMVAMLNCGQTNSVTWP